ncbi:ABC transporter substrate-binding protein [Caproiciproducens sp.]
MKNMKRALALFLTLAMICTTMAGCGGTADSASSAASSAEGSAAGTEKSGTTFGLTPLDKPTTLRVGFFSGSAHSMPFYIADKMGFFKELNIDVEYESFINGPAMMEVSSNWDVCDVGGPGVLNGMKNHDVHLIGLCDNELNTALFVRPDSDLAKDPANPDLWKGKTIILNSGTTLQYMCASYLNSIGSSINDVNIVSMDVTSSLTAFKAGQGDAVCAWNAVAYNADDSGLVRVTDMSKMGLNNVCGLCATGDAVKNKADLLKLTWMVYYMTAAWCQESDANMSKAVELYVQSCEDEGVASSESICERALKIFKCPSVKESYTDMTTKVTDRSGSGEVLQASNYLFETLDFFIGLGSYTAADRKNILDKGLVDSSVAESCKDTLTQLGYLS